MGSRARGGKKQGYITRRGQSTGSVARLVYRTSQAEHGTMGHLARVRQSPLLHFSLCFNLSCIHAYPFSVLVHVQRDWRGLYATLMQGDAVFTTRIWLQKHSFHHLVSIFSTGVRKIDISENSIVVKEVSHETSFWYRFISLPRYCFSLTKLFVLAKNIEYSYRVVVLRCVKCPGWIPGLFVDYRRTGQQCLWMNGKGFCDPK